jgi:hypothetical protein
VQARLEPLEGAGTMLAETRREWKHANSYKHVRIFQGQEVALAGTTHLSSAFALPQAQLLAQPRRVRHESVICWRLGLHLAMLLVHDQPLVGQPLQLESWHSSGGR